MSHEGLAAAQSLKVFIVYSIFSTGYLLSSPNYLGILYLFKYLNNYLAILSSYFRRLLLFK